MSKLIIALPLDDVKVGSVVKCNPFIHWGDGIDDCVEFKFSHGDCYYAPKRKWIDGEWTVKNIVHGDKVHHKSDYYARQMLLVKGVDYE